MNLKQSLAIGTLATSILIGTPEKAKSNNVVDTTKSKLEDIIKTEKNDILTTKLTQKLNKLFYRKKISDFSKTPLEMGGIHDRENLKQFLGLNQYKLIFEKYNKDIAKYDSKGNLLTYKSTYKNDELIIPRIFDELREYFPDKLEDFLNSNPDYIKKVGNDKTVILTGKTEQGRHILAYYEDGILDIATHISPGKISKAVTKKKKDKTTGELKTVIIPGGNYSPEGVYKITKSDYYKFKKSRTFELSPMPYALQITGGVFCHHGQDVDGTKKYSWLHKNTLIIPRNASEDSEKLSQNSFGLN